MRIYGISDLHLSFTNPKPMEKFGEEWKDHFRKIELNWKRIVSDNDLVLIPGDISWATKYRDALPDLAFIEQLPGKKVILKGNHDFWWKSVSKLRKIFSEHMNFIQNDLLSLNEIAISGTRLWNFPFIEWHTSGFFPNLELKSSQHEKIRKREMERLKACLDKFHGCSTSERIFLTHFPPIGPDEKENMITNLLSEHEIDLCAFGHLHGLPKNEGNSFDRRVGGVRYVLVSCDCIGFCPKLLLEI